MMAFSEPYHPTVGELVQCTAFEPPHFVGQFVLGRVLEIDPVGQSLITRPGIDPAGESHWYEPWQVEGLPPEKGDAALMVRFGSN